MTTPAIARFLLALDDALTLPPTERARVLAECEEHLADAVAARVGAGVEPAEAEHHALERFGDVEVVAATFAREAGLHAAPFTLVRRLDAWRTDHIVLGAALATLPLLLVLALLLGVMIALLAPPGQRPGIGRGLVANGASVWLIATLWFLGRVAAGWMVRRNPQPLHSQRMSALRRERPVAHAVVDSLVPFAGVSASMALTWSVPAAAFFTALLVVPLLSHVSAARWLSRRRFRLRLRGTGSVVCAANAAIPTILQPGPRSYVALAIAFPLTLGLATVGIKRVDTERPASMIAILVSLAVVPFAPHALLVGGVYLVIVPLVMVPLMAVVVLVALRAAKAGETRARLAAEARAL